MTNAEIFRKAADYIREHGWARGASGGVGEPNVPACLLGAVAATLGIKRRELWQPSWHTAYRLLGERIQSPDCVGMWNDAPGRTAEQVIALFEDLAFDEDLKAAAQSPLPAEPSPIIPTREAVPVG